MFIDTILCYIITASVFWILSLVVSIETDKNWRKRISLSRRTMQTLGA